ncbi:hypothetical protein ACVW2B_002209 [Ewingella americana]
MNTLFNLLNKIAISAMQRSEIVGAAIALAIVFMLIIPLPLPLIDVLIAVNISLSSLLIVLAMYLPKPLAFSTFHGGAAADHYVSHGAVDFHHSPNLAATERRAHRAGVR